MDRYKLSPLGLTMPALVDRFGQDVRASKQRSQYKDLPWALCLLVDGASAPEHWGEEFWELYERVGDPDIEPETTPKKGKGWASEKTLKAAELIRKGLTMNEVVELTGVHRGTLRAYVERRNIKYVGRGRASSKQMDEAAALVSQGVSLNEAATRMGVKIGSLKVRLKLQQDTTDYGKLEEEVLGDAPYRKKE